MKVVYEAANLIDAHLVRHALEAEEIPVFLRGEQLLGGMGELPLFGVIAVCVPDIALPRAQEIVAAMPIGQAALEDGDGDEDEDDLREGDAGWLPA